jgi:Sulfotransferase domain
VYTFTIQSLVKTRPWINGVESHLDAPAAEAYATPRFCLPLQGWVACASARIGSIWLAWRGTRIADASISARPDVEAAYPGSRHVVGFSIDAVPLVFGDSEPLKVVLETTDGRSSVLFEITLRFLRESQGGASDDDAGERIIFAPLLALPRSGTTYLSTLLHGNAATLGVYEYPYEARFGAHLCKEWFASMQPRFYGPVARNSQDMDQNLLSMLKILRGEASGADARLTAFFSDARRHYRAKIVDLYKMLSSRPSACVIVEKLGLKLELGLLGGLFNTRPIFLVRDPRDILLSMRDFNQRRGVYDFHQEQAKNFSELLYALSSSLMQLSGLHDRHPGEKMLVRYEDLVRDPTGVLTRILQFIGITSSAAESKRIVESAAVHTQHITADSPAASVGRWKTELTASEQEMMNWHLQAFLSRFSY